MKTTNFLISNLSAAACVVGFSVSAAYAVDVVDPISGETVEISEVDFTALSRSEVRDIYDQLEEQGYTRDEARDVVREEQGADFGALEVTDPTTGETVTLAEIDFSTLTGSEAREIASELRDDGISGGAVRNAIRNERREDVGAVEVVDPVSGETVTLASIDRSELTDEQREDIRDQLEEQGVETGRGGGDGERPSRGGERGGDRGGRGGDR